jgi:hypothetical protein
MELLDTVRPAYKAEPVACSEDGFWANWSYDLTAPVEQGQKRALQVPQAGFLHGPARDLPAFFDEHVDDELARFVRGLFSYGAANREERWSEQNQ